MKARTPAALALLLLPGLAAARPIERRLGPIRLVGAQPPMQGPEATDRFRFPEPGWIRGYSVHVVDSRGARVDGAGLFCHAAFIGGQRFDGDPVPGLGIHTISSKLSTAEGANSVRFPEGYGMAVDTATLYEVAGVLQSPGHQRDGSYSMDVSFDFAPAGGPDAIVPLDVWRVDISTIPSHDWEVPPGRHSYSAPFGVPRDLVVHLIDFHLHRFVESVELLDVSTGRPLYRAEIERRKDGFAREQPSYSSAKGIPLSRGKRYAFRVAYDNPLNADEKTMALMRLYVSR